MTNRRPSVSGFGGRTKTAWFGPDRDGSCRRRLIEVLQSMDGVPMEPPSWDWGGSHVVGSFDVAMRDGVLHIESEACVGLWIRGPAEVVDPVYRKVGNHAERTAKAAGARPISRHDRIAAGVFLLGFGVYACYRAAIAMQGGYFDGGGRSHPGPIDVLSEPGAFMWHMAILGGAGLMFMLAALFIVIGYPDWVTNFEVTRRLQRRSSRLNN